MVAEAGTPLQARRCCCCWNLLFATCGDLRTERICAHTCGESRMRTFRIYGDELIGHRKMRIFSRSHEGGLHLRYPSLKPIGADTSGHASGDML